MLSFQALNSAGAGPFSATASCMTPSSSPGAVLSVRASATATTVRLTWKEPNCNGSEIISFNIDIGEKHLISVGNVLEYVIEELMPETAYKWVASKQCVHFLFVYFLSHQQCKWASFLSGHLDQLISLASQTFWGGLVWTHMLSCQEVFKDKALSCKSLAFSFNIP